MGRLRRGCRDGHAYHAPLAGSLFIAEILFGTLMLASLGPVVISAVIALLLTQFLNGGARRCITSCYSRTSAPCTMA